MRKRNTFGVGILAVTLLSIALTACSPAQAAPLSASQQTSRYITVVGIGEVSLTPDIALINVGAEASAETVSQAKTEVDRRVEAIMAVLTGMGIADKDIQTSHYSIYYEREPVYPVAIEERSQEPNGAYRVSNMLRVTIRDLDQVSDVLDAVIEAGANQMYGVTFTVSDEREWEKEAREKAMADAKARAEALALLAEVELGEVLSVSEVVGAEPLAARRSYSGMDMAAGGIAPGELDLSTSIQVTFAIQ
ncbi:MAG: SIMPL domain-containing protein [Chloroflexota bacterium]|nr:SIMPL domain-containing protein [Chloroflexota bacterium]